MDDDNEDLFSLIMPFVTVTSRGGPHDDASFGAGFQMGQLDVMLKESAIPVDWTILTECVPQADLIAMRHGFTMSAEETGVPTWSHVTFTP